MVYSPSPWAQANPSLNAPIALPPPPPMRPICESTCTWPMSAIAPGFGGIAPDAVAATTPAITAPTTVETVPASAAASAGSMVLRLEGATAEAFELVAFVAFAVLLFTSVAVGMGVVLITAAGVVLFVWLQPGHGSQCGSPAPCPSKQDPASHGGVISGTSVHVADTFAADIPARSANAGNSHTRLGQME